MRFDILSLDLQRDGVHMELQSWDDGSLHILKHTLGNETATLSPAYRGLSASGSLVLASGPRKTVKAPWVPDAYPLDPIDLEEVEA